jgi:hypothetical protein
MSVEVGSHGAGSVWIRMPWSILLVVTLLCLAVLLVGFVRERKGQVGERFRRVRSDRG